VSGKGVPAALFMMVVKTMIRDHASMKLSTAEIFNDVNRLLCENNTEEMFATAWIGILDTETRIMKCTNAGHNAVCFAKKGGKFEFLKQRHGVFLAGFDTTQYKESEIQFESGDSLFLYTDGLTEAENATHEQFGVDRTKAALSGRKSAQEHLDNIKRHVTDFVGDAPQSDDLTILFIHYVPSSHHLTLKNDIGQVSLLPAFVEDAVKASGLDPDVTGKLTLALEEAVVNVIDYAYPEGVAGEVDIDAATTDKALVFTITDKGKPFDPTSRGEVDINAGVEERPVGGLGIHLVRQIMDDVRYERRVDKNVLILTKKY
jgi:anti-sigma regulatory factor (Ser/Thr protein kinase)